MTTKMVRVTKVEALPDRPNGIGSGGPIVEGYYVIGEEEYPPKVGLSYCLERHERNGVKQYGQFWTSEVKKLDIVNEDTTLITTCNSVYKIECLK
jgi:hypothetical protein